MNFNLLILPALVSAILAYFFTPFVIRLAWKLKMIDDPKTNKHPKVLHTVPTPRGGGLAIFLAILIAAIVFLPFDKHTLGIFVGAFILVVMGLLDDKYNLNPYVRLGIQFLAALCPIIAGIGIAFLTNPVNGIFDFSHFQITFDLLGKTRSIWVLSDLFALFWIVTIINFLNIGAKGVPGQLPGVVAIAAGTIAVLSLSFSADITEWPVIMLAAITMGAYLGFLPWNAFPQKIMPSFAGSNLGGYLLAVLAILSTTKVGTLMVVLAVPLIDTGYTVIRRILAGKSPVWGDRGHLHHKLIDKVGLSPIQVSFLYWGFTLLLGILALNLNASSKLYTIIGVAIAILGTLLWLTHRSK